MWPFSSAPKDGIPTFEVENTIGTGTRVFGDIRGPGGVRIDGTVEGAIEVDGPVVVGEGGTVEGGIRGRDVVVHGRVRGDVFAAGHLEIGPKGKIAGDITTESFRMHKGGVFRGTSRMAGADDLVAAALPELPAALTRGARGRTLPPPAGAVPPPAPTPLMTPPAESGVISQERVLTPADFESSEEDRATG